MYNDLVGNLNSCMQLKQSTVINQENKEIVLNKK
jgi:hypothetical protein